jgi:hypothetical protein
VTGLRSIVTGPGYNFGLNCDRLWMNVVQVRVAYNSRRASAAELAALLKSSKCSSINGNCPAICSISLGAKFGLGCDMFG